jgi:hypothetical protein
LDILNGGLRERIEVLGNDSDVGDNPIAPFGDGESHECAVRVPDDVNCRPVWNVFKMDVGEYPIDQRCFATKFHPELMTDSAVSAVAADQPRAFGSFLGAVGVTQGRYNVVVGCGEPGQSTVRSTFTPRLFRNSSSTRSVSLCGIIRP